jgi:hypothetical protein
MRREETSDFDRIFNPIPLRLSLGLFTLFLCLGLVASSSIGGLLDLSTFASALVGLLLSIFAWSRYENEYGPAWRTPGKFMRFMLWAMVLPGRRRGWDFYLAVLVFGFVIALATVLLIRH